MTDAAADCVFCDIVAGRAPSHVVAEDAGSVSFLDINPVNPGHTLTVPRRHARDIFDLSGTEFGSLSAAAHAVALRLRRALDPPGLDLFVANGAAGGQTAFHVHIHAIPRWPGDGWTDPWVPTPGDPAELAEVAERLRADPD